MNIEKIQKELQNNLSEKRYNHSLMVADQAKSLAIKYQLNYEEAYLAGLLHDIAKELTLEENIRLVNKYQLPKELLQDEYNKIIHADIGAELAKERYNINDNIYYAIKYHTIGNENMNAFAKIIFIADKIGRKNLKPELELIKELAFQDIDKSILKFLELSSKKLTSQGLKVHFETEKLYHKLKKNTKQMESDDE